MHIRQTHEGKDLEWFFYCAGEGVALKYKNKNVEWTYKRKTYNSGDAWISLVNDSNPFRSEPISSSEYLDLFDVMLSYTYDMNLLENRKCLSGVSVIRKYIDYNLKRRKQRVNPSGMKMATVFETGQGLYNPLCKKNAIEGADYWRAYPQKFDSTLHEGRSNKANHYLPTVNRASNEAVRNSKALAFPTDAFYFYCPLTTKDLKSAGEQHVLADMVIMTEETDELLVYNYLKTFTKGRDTLILNGYIIRCQANVTLDFLVKLKHKFPHVTTKYYPPYILISTKDSILIKYSAEYNCFFSPAEVTHFTIKFPEYDMLSITAKELGESVQRTPVSKNTVAINNLRGSVANKESDLHVKFMESSLGITCYIEKSDSLQTTILESAILNHNQDTTHTKQCIQLINETFQYNKLEPMKKTPEHKARAIMTQMYNLTSLLLEYKIGTGCPFNQERDINKKALIQRYVDILFSQQYNTSPTIWNLKLWAAFGVNEACVEDGIILDKKTVALLPPIIYNACFTVDFVFKNAKQPKDARFITISNEVNMEQYSETLVGCLITEYEVIIKNSNHCRINVSKIGNHFYYLLHFLPKNNNTYKNMKVQCIQKFKQMTVVITGKHIADIGIGTKFANAFGQKNVCSKIEDLSNCWGITNDGRKVHAQIMYSDSTIVGRLAAGQLQYMLSSSNVAYGPNGEIIAPIDLVIHTLHPYTNIKLFNIKMDTLSDINGCHAQNIANASLMLRQAPVYDKTEQLVGFHGLTILRYG